MEVQAVEKYIRTSQKKARLVADAVRGQNAVSALATLRFMPKKAATIIYKALHSAVSNATNNEGLDKNTLVISKITVDKGPSLKRFRPRSRGMASALLKRTSHITVVVSGEKLTKAATTTVKKTEKPVAKTAKATEGSK